MTPEMIAVDSFAKARAAGPEPGSVSGTNPTCHTAGAIPVPLPPVPDAVVPAVAPAPLPCVPPLVSKSPSSVLPHAELPHADRQTMKPSDNRAGVWVERSMSVASVLSGKLALEVR